MRSILLDMIRFIDDAVMRTEQPISVDDDLKAGDAKLGEDAAMRTCEAEHRKVSRRRE